MSNLKSEKSEKSEIGTINRNSEQSKIWIYSIR